MRSLVKMICLLLLITLLMAALASAFAEVGYDASKRWEPDIDPDIDPPEMQDLSDLLPDPLNDTELLMIGGAVMGRIVDEVGVTYDDGWTGADDMSPFVGGVVDIPEDVNGIERMLTITPLVNITGPLPIGVETSAVYTNGVAMSRSPSTGVIEVSDVISSSYDVVCIVTDGDPATAEAVLDPTYLQVPDIGMDLESMAEDIVSDGSAYERACQIASFLVRERDMSMTGGDLRHFLEGTSPGSPEDFVTGYALLARSVGIPARVSYGFHLDGTGDQVLRAMDYTLFGDVLLEGLGWVDVPFCDGGEEEPDVVALMYHDVHKDGAMDLSDPLLGDGTVMLTDLSGSPIASTSSEDGTFALSVEEGTYLLEAIGPEGWTNVSPSVIMVTVGDGVVEATFGMAPEDPIGLTPTMTDITHSDAVVMRDATFTVSGTVTDTLGGPVSGPMVVVYVSQEKTGTERHPIGQGAIVGGSFSVECIIGDAPVIGEQQLIARCMGDGTYAPSESDPVLEVYDSTVLSLEGPLQVVQGRSASFEVCLTEASTGDPVPWAALSLDGSGTVITNASGVGAFTLPFADAGDVRLYISYGGEGYLLGSDVERDVEVLPLEVDVVDGVLTRNSLTSVTFDVHAGPLPVDNESVDVDIIPLTSATTNANGVCTLETEVGDESLGPRTAVVTVMGQDRTVTLSFASTTSLTVAIEDGEAIALLVDDHGEPVEGQLTFEAEGRTEVAIVDVDGAACPLDGIGGSELTVTYAGSSGYLASSDSIVMPDEGLVPGWFQWWYLLPLLAIPAAIIATRKRDPDGTVIPERPIGQPVHGLRYVGIDEDLPPVWSEGEDVSLIVPDGVNGVSIDGSVVAHDGTVPLQLAEGEHTLTVKGPRNETVETVRVVDYREEIVRLYDDAVDDWVLEHDVSRDMSPREVQRRIEAKDVESMETIVSTFESADYSEHPMTRQDYVLMYRALRRLDA